MVGTAHIDLRALAPQLRLEFQYALQCRYDARSRVAPPRMVTPAVRLVSTLGIASLLDLSEQQWRDAAAARPNQSLIFLLDARYAIEALRDGSGWEVEYPRDVWRLDRLPGIAGQPAVARVLAPGCGSTASLIPGCVIWANDGPGCA